MMIRIYAGNLPSSADQESIKSLFEPFGPIYSVQVFNTPFRSSAKIEMATYGGRAAISALNAKPYGDYLIRVHEALPKQVY